jgi:predicted alpha/beta superfamily hydrolase
VALAIGLLAPGWAAAADLQVVSEGPAATSGARRIVVHSQRVGRDFVVDVSVPAGMAPGHKAPAIYALDGGYGVALPIGRMLGDVGAMEPAVIVALAAAGDAANARLVDMLYEPATIGGKPTGGGGRAFEGFILEELRPFIEARFAADPARAVLFGHSAGGLFAASLLAKAPQAFSGWLIASPSVWIDPGVVERARAAKGAAVRQRVFVSVGGAEEPAMLQGAQALAGALNGQFEVSGRAYGGEGHMTYYPMLVASAFPWLLPPEKRP